MNNAILKPHQDLELLCILVIAVADPGENLTGALHSKFERGGCGGRG